MKKNKRFFRRSLTFLVIMCWTLPLFLMASVVLKSYRQSIVEKTRTLIEGEIVNDTEYLMLRIDEAVRAVKNLTYDQLIYAESLQESWRLYKKGRIMETKLTNDVNRYLSQAFQERLYICAALYMPEGPEEVYYSVRYAQKGRESFNAAVREKTEEIFALGGSDTHIRVVENRIFVIRNMYTVSNYEQFATLAVELDTDVVFSNVSLGKSAEGRFYFEDPENYIVLSGADELYFPPEIYTWATEALFSGDHNTGFFEDERFEVYTYSGYNTEYKSTSVIAVDKSEIYKEFKEFIYLLLLLGAGIVPVLFLILYFLNRHITRPVERMIEASKAVREGDIGYQIEGKPMPNQEFAYLRESFNKMSSEVKLLFEYGRQEELARRDARILALQSQINPHFLNNTLEMMNWQARLAGDVKTSKMIEALSTLLNYSMGREDKRLCSLREELICVDAYFYISSMRFGSRLTFRKEIDDCLMDVQVPQLILQPILENAVVHGIEKVRKGTIHLSVFREGDDVCLKVTNTGPEMKKEDQEHIRKILEGEEDVPQGRGKHVSLGIRNVNQRIRLIFGDEYGLEIYPGGKNEIVSVIRIPHPEKPLSERSRIMNKIMEEHP